LTKNPLIYSVSYFTLGLGVCFWLPTDICFENCITKPCQVGHRPFECPPLITINVLRSTVIALNNFIQYSHWQVVQPFRLTPLLIKAFTTIISKNIVHLCVRFSD